MEIFNQKSVEDIHRELSLLRKNLEAAMMRIGVLKSDLEGFESPEYEHFKTKVLEKERIRLALIGMTIGAEKTLLHERLQGQFNEVEMLMSGRDDTERMLKSTQRQANEFSVKIDRLKKQLERQSERKTK